MSDSIEPSVISQTITCSNVPGKAIGVLWLNRPAQLNALNLEMCETLLLQLRHFAADESIVAVMLAGKGEKGFCAGGDVAQVIRQVRAGGPARYVYGDCFFDVEYQLDLLIHRFPKPLITWAHGVNMGGGVGLSVGGAVRIVSQNAKIAMPEIHIGLFPDVGGGWFLNRVPGGAGLLMALTGLMLNEADALFAGVADLCIGYQHQAEFIQGLSAITWGQTRRDHLAQTIHYAREVAAREPVLMPESGLRKHFDVIHDIAGRAKLNGVMKGLEQAAKTDTYFVKPAENLSKGSPTAANITFEYMKR
jgi:enoyl-CoA hydratase/carnithine racemase